MALSLSPTARHNLKCLAVCFSLGNLLFVRRWYDLEILQEPGMDYHRIAPASPLLLFATLVCGLIMGAAFAAGWLWTRRGGPVVKKIAQGVLLLSLIFPLESVRRYWNTQTEHFDAASNAALVALELLLAVGLVMAIRGNPRVVRSAFKTALILSFLYPALLLDFGMKAISSPPASAYQSRPPAAALPVRPDSQRLIWIVFDEFDQRVAFEERPASVQLPELDRLRAESLVASHATETADFTGIALPSLISGRFFKVTSMMGASRLDVTPEGSSIAGDWRDQPNAFQHARAMGINAAVDGWYHPYCRIFGDQLVQCFAMPSGHAGRAMLRERHADEHGMWSTVAFLFRLQWENVKDLYRFDGTSGSEDLKASYLQKEQQHEYFTIRDHAYAAAVDPNIGFLLIHMPTPHMYAIYNRKEANFTLNPTLDYLDNLALVDRTVGELRRKLEAAGLWDRTNLLITSDHGFRPYLWRGNYGWTPNMEQLFAGGASPLVPFILKLAGKSEHAVFDKNFSNIVCGDLSLAVLGGKVSTAGQAIAWLDQKTSETQKTVSQIPSKGVMAGGH
jgi:Type I phosphodiesterase / nucleotide pyrophosphatase